MKNWLRSFVIGVFAVEAFICFSFLPIAVFVLLQSRPHRSQFDLLGYLLPPSIFIPVGLVFALAWWTAKKRKAYARGWGVAASLVNVLLAVPMLYYFQWTATTLLWMPLVGGVCGLFVFVRRDTSTVPSNEPTLEPIAGDGTSNLVNRFHGAIAFVLAVAAVTWWLRWARASGYQRNSDVLFYVQVFVAIILSTVIHELGHAGIGYALGMKLRIFVVGPFRLQNQHGRWEFQFEPRAILAGGGMTGVVPSSANQPRWRSVFMIAGGPLANLLAAILVFGNLSRPAVGPATAVDALAGLVGAFCLVAFLMNLIPKQTANYYTDGAQIYQLLSGGPWGDWHRASSLVTSSLVTSVRPRDYDLATIQRALLGIPRGKIAMLLRLYAYNHFLDCGRMSDAGRELAAAEAVALEPALNIRVELYTVFVFGNALVKQDAAGARLWWERMEAKKPTRFDGDYWMAHSALHWIEGDLDTANESWQKGYSIAQQLPDTGAYEFDRYCFRLLREAMDGRKEADSVLLTVPDAVYSVLEPAT